jgi:L-alanine-DL-glutamate epimerase-like enolase superfamily enzyme
MMTVQRRHFLRASLLGAAGAPAILSGCRPGQSSETGSMEQRYRILDEVLAQPVLNRAGLDDPLIVERLELKRYHDSFICEVHAENGAHGISVGNNMQLKALYPIFSHRLQPYFIGKDARDLEALLDGVYVYKSNYKLQNLALWVPLATIEFALLDMLGKVAGRSMGQMIGEIHNPEIAVYQANNYRGRSAEESVERMKKNVEESQAQAMKIKVGGRMSKNADYPPGRTENLIPLVRKTFGDDMTIYADSNGSYDTAEAIRIGKMLEEYQYDFYEEPVPFDWYEETRAVADALGIPVAGGEQEPSMRRFRWLIAHDALDVVQPDMFYFGGMVRSMKVARMAAALGKPCTPHISGSGLGYLYMMHFVSAIPNAGPYHEFKGFNNDIPMQCDTSSLTSQNGVVQVPTGPGLGVEIDRDFVEKHVLVRDA